MNDVTDNMWQSKFVRAPTNTVLEILRPGNSSSRPTELGDAAPDERFGAPVVFHRSFILRAASAKQAPLSTSRTAAWAARRLWKVRGITPASYTARRRPPPPAARAPPPRFARWGGKKSDFPLPRFGVGEVPRRGGGGEPGIPPGEAEGATQALPPAGTTVCLASFVSQQRLQQCVR
jgi:hypothetical protein